MPVEIYGMQLSAPCRIVGMTCEVLKVPYEFKETDLMKGEHKTPEFLKMNPQHNIPTMKDGDFCMNESRAIATYIINAYGKDDCKLYPKDPKVRGVIDQRLYFDMGSFYKAFGDTVYPLAFGDGKVEDDKYERLTEVLGWVNDFVKKTGWVAGTDHLTLADIAFLASYASIVEAGQSDLSKYPELNAWYEKAKKEIPNYDKCNGSGAKEFGGWIKSKLSG